MNGFLSEFIEAKLLLVFAKLKDKFWPTLQHLITIYICPFQNVKKINLDHLTVAYNLCYERGKLNSTALY